MIRFALLPSLAAAAAVTIGAASSAAPASAHIFEGGPAVVDACSVDRGGPYGGRSGDVHITYHNRNPIALTRVVFRVNYRGVRRQIVDVGTFTQGAEIAHSFDRLEGAAPFSGPNPNVCTVVAAQFANGRVWHRADWDDRWENE